MGECVARQAVRWGNVYNAVSPQFRRLLCLGWSCHRLLLSVVPMVSGKMCWGEHRKSNTKLSPIVRNSDVACVKTAVEAHKGDCDGFVGSGEVGLAAHGDGGTEAEGLGAADGGLGISNRVSSHTNFFLKSWSIIFSQPHYVIYIKYSPI